MRRLTKVEREWYGAWATIWSITAVATMVAMRWPA